MRPELPAKKQAAAGRPRGTFVQAKRLDRARQALEQSPGGITIEELADQLRCSERTVRRYLPELHRALDLESFEPVQGEAWRWRIKPSEQSRAVVMRRTHAYALLSAKPHFAPLKGSALADEVEGVNRELLKLAQRPTKRGVRGEVRSDSRFEDRFIHLAPPHRVYPAHTACLDDLFLAAANLTPVDAVLSDAKGVVVRSVLHPYAVVIHQGGISIIGLLLAFGAIVIRPLEAFESVSRLSGETFPLPNDFEVARYVDGHFGLTETVGDKVVTIDFDASRTEEIRHTFVHPSQLVGISRRGGGVRFRFVVANLANVIPWILRFGGSAKVLGPQVLIDAVRSEAQAILARYPGKGD